ncbi:hypothetical protein GE061_015153 [Apolygus lucorum]|uniref:Uncharacterized protein n=1 Tax=Apolygus lucorum TaxID=248454 RepID=A0A8S9XN02_APOLU|nr:hypothetical protein GE061_015153 [Apolygus lucorum]
MHPTEKGTAQGNYGALLNQLAIVEEKLNSIEKKFCEEIDSSITPPISSLRMLNNQIQNLPEKDLFICALVDKLARSISSLDNSMKQKPLTKTTTTGTSKANNGGNIAVETLQVYPAQLEPERTGQMYWPRKPKSWKTEAPPKPSPNQRLLRSRSPPPSPLKPILVERGTQTAGDSGRLPLCIACKQNVFSTPENFINHQGDFGNALLEKLQSIGSQNGVLTKRPDERNRNGQSKYISKRLDKLVQELTAPKEYPDVRGDGENLQNDLEETTWKAESLPEKGKRLEAKFHVKSKVGLRSTPTKIKLKSRRFYYPKSSIEVKRQAEKLAKSLVQKLMKKRDLQYEGYKAFPTSIIYKNSAISRPRGNGRESQGSYGACRRSTKKFTLKLNGGDEKLEEAALPATFICLNI